MSFIGKVTRKEQDTGVTLEAKVVAPNKKQSSKQQFKVRVKANTLDDFTCCVLDHAAAVSRINTMDITAVTTDITSVLSYYGEHGTSITYKIIDTSSPKLSEYLAENGAVKDRPKYGEGNATGYIEIIVSKNEASVNSRLVAGVKCIEADEVLAGVQFSQQSLWNTIRGTNDSYQSSSIWSGHKNIMNKLTFIDTIDSSDSKTPATVSWNIEDDTVSYASANGIYTEARISDDGSVLRVPYKDACKLLGTAINATLVDTVSNSTISNPLTNRVRIGGITITATITLGESKKIVKFDCATISKYITNAEVMDAVTDYISLTRPDGGAIYYKEAADSSYTTLAPTSDGEYTLRAYKNATNFSSTELKLTTGEIIGVSITNDIKGYDGITNYDATLLATAFSGGFQADEVDGSNYDKLSINVANLMSATEENKKFSCVATVIVSGYSKDGLSAGGESASMKRYCPIIIDTSAVVVTPPASSGSGTTTDGTTTP